VPIFALLLVLLLLIAVRISRTAPWVDWALLVSGFENPGARTKKRATFVMLTAQS
jgi:hypothetical protein